MGDIGRHRQRIHSLCLQLGHNCPGSVRLKVGHRYRRACLAQRVGIRAADALAATRDQRHPPIETEPLQNRP